MHTCINLCMYFALNELSLSLSLSSTIEFDPVTQKKSLRAIMQADADATYVNVKHT